MKNKNYFLTIFVIAIMLGCKKDSVFTKNMMSYDGKEYNLSTGIIEYSGGVFATPGFNHLDLILVSSNIQLIEADGVVDDYVGTGNILYIEAYSPKTDGFSVGKYPFSENKKSNTFVRGDAYLNFNTKTLSGDKIQIVGGEMSVIKRVGDNYEISFDLDSKEGKKLKAYFNGTLKYYFMQ